MANGVFGQFSKKLSSVYIRTMLRARYDAFLPLRIDFFFYNKITFIIIRSLFARQGSFLHRKWHSFDELCKKSIYNFRGCHDTRKEYFAFPFPFRLEIIPSLIHSCEIPKISIYFYLNRNTYIPLNKIINILRGKYYLTLYPSYMLIANVA